MSKNLENLFSRLADELKRVGPDTIAAATGISRATIYNWINRGNVPLDKLPLLEKAGLNADYILTGERSGAGGLSREETALLDNYRHCSKEVQTALEAASLSWKKQKVKGKAA
ncbi:MAG: helix-turn-helix domain containing protein [Zoogloeaceae bacterium]|jgi:transcriptional antiterminator|nr:helix-turn-helix domain containing protein [Zoogloeaceae bacterium]